MSGTSLDGLDLALCRFNRTKGEWFFEVEAASFIAYDDVWRNHLLSAYQSNISSLSELNTKFGAWLGDQVKAFLIGNQPLDLIASHGHTTHHEPKNGVTNQIGCGQTIANITGVKTIYDFRTQDVRLGGQGAPLVPIGDKLLFSQYDACMNLGGFSNISFESDDTRKAFDICPVNIVLNPIAETLGKPFDENGELARSGELNLPMLMNLKSMMEPFRIKRPSLSREWVELNVNPIISTHLGPAALIRTLSEFAAEEIASVLNDQNLSSVLMSGGGSYNSFLMERLRSKTDCEIIVPEKTIIDFKEAIVFAFLGVLRDLNEINILKSVTGATHDSSSGIVAEPA